MDAWKGTMAVFARFGRGWVVMEEGEKDLEKGGEEEECVGDDGGHEGSHEGFWSRNQEPAGLKGQNREIESEM